MNLVLSVWKKNGCSAGSMVVQKNHLLTVIDAATHQTGNNLYKALLIILFSTKSSLLEFPIQQLEKYVELNKCIDILLYKVRLS